MQSVHINTAFFSRVKMKKKAFIQWENVFWKIASVLFYLLTWKHTKMNINSKNRFLIIISVTKELRSSNCDQIPAA